MDEDGEDVRGDLRWGTVAGLVRSAAQRYAGREAVVDGRVRIDYAQLGDRVERAAAACLAAGVEPGDRVAVWAPNSLEWIVSALGAVSAGAVLVPLNTRFKGAEAAYVLGRSRARLLFVTGTFLGTSYVAPCAGPRPRAPGAGRCPTSRTWSRSSSSPTTPPSPSARGRSSSRAGTAYRPGPSASAPTPSVPTPPPTSSSPPEPRAAPRGR